MDEVIEHLLPAIEEQLASPDTRYVAETLDRLLTDQEIDEQEAKAMLAFCLADEMEAMLREDRPFAEARYRTLLDLLPALPEGR
ncbi:MAG: hypothetical protein ACSHYF_14865 [Verrucomicrobiaceae bacterium]